MFVVHQCNLYELSVRAAKTIIIGEDVEEKLRETDKEVGLRKILFWVDF